MKMKVKNGEYEEEKIAVTLTERKESGKVG